MLCTLPQLLREPIATNSRGGSQGRQVATGVAPRFPTGGDGVSQTVGSRIVPVSNGRHAQRRRLWVQRTKLRCKRRMGDDQMAGAILRWSSMEKGGWLPFRRQHFNTSLREHHGGQIWFAEIRWQQCEAEEETVVLWSWR